jgi:hypothetical protein
VERSPMTAKFWKMTSRKQLPKVSSQGHWLQKSSYPDWWIERSELLFSLFHGSAHFNETTTFSEYGCGPHMPFRSAVAKNYPQMNCHALDLKAWDSGVIVADLDKADISALPNSDCGVLCGVIEYLRSPAATFGALSTKHSLLLFSYCYSDMVSTRLPKEKVQSLAARAAMGWRNHLSIDRLVTDLSSFGYICEISHWRDQALILAKRFD